MVGHSSSWWITKSHLGKLRCERRELRNKAVTFSISGKKFNDLNANGINDGEPGLAGWTINLEQPAGKVIRP